MTVEKLKKILNEYPDDMEVVVDGSEPMDFQLVETAAEETTILLIVPII